METEAFVVSDQGLEPVPFATLASEVVREVLGNGLRILVKEVYPTRVVSLGLWVGVGSVDDPADAWGLSHFLEHLLFKAAPCHVGGGLAQAVHELGGYLNGFTSLECTCYWTVLPSRHLEEALRLLVRAARDPRFEGDLVAREVPVVLQELRMYQDRPEARCLETLLALAFEGHPYGRPVLGTEESLASVSADRLERHYRQTYRAENVALVLVGDLHPAMALEMARELTFDWAPGAACRPAHPPARFGTGARRARLSVPSTGAHLQVAFAVPELAHPDSAACDLLASMLGRGRASRLVRQLRERKGLVTNVGASVLLERERGLLVVDAVSTPDRADAAEAALFSELTEVREHGLSAGELNRAHNQVEAQFILAQETVEGQGRKLGHYERLGDYRRLETWMERLAAVDPEDLQRVASRYLVPENSCLVRCGPTP